jgi:hypothetical protein
MKDLIRKILREEFLLTEQRVSWTKELIQNIANNYKTRGEFQKKDINAYTAAKRKGWLEDVTKHMSKPKTVKYTTQTFKQEAKQIHGDKYGYDKVNYVDSITPVQIICPIHGEFSQKPAQHLQGQNCKKCGYEIVASKNKMKDEVFFERLKELFGDNYDLSEIKYKDSSTPVKLICPKHGDFYKTPNALLSKKEGCPTCGYDRRTKINTKSFDEFLNDARSVHGNLYDYSQSNYKNGVTDIDIICPTHGKFQQQPYSHLNGKGCSKCKGGVMYNTQEFIQKARNIHNDNYDYSQVNYVDSQTPVTIVCPSHGEFQQKPVVHLVGSGCLKCSGKEVFNNDDFIEKSNIIHNNFYDYSKSNYERSDKKVEIICPKHGLFLMKPNGHLGGQGCPVCKQSKGEKLLADLLNKNNIKYNRQHKFKDCTNNKFGKSCKKLSFDFYLPEYNTCLEYDGEQHFRPVGLWGGLKGFENTQRLDNIKNDYCLKNNIKMIRVPYTIKNNDVELYIKKELGITS